MNDELIYCLWLQDALGSGADCGKITGYFGSPSACYEAGEDGWKASGILTQNKIDKLKKTTPAMQEKLIADCDKNGWKIVTPYSEYFPANLRNIHAVPMALYVKGDVNTLKTAASVSVVGPREPSELGKVLALESAYLLGSKGVTVISGAAKGIDGLAHRAAMHAGGKTIAFLGCGFRANYLRENEALRQKISENGALVTEYRPDVQASKWTFPVRNRLISGLSDFLIVVEGEKRSGTMITANAAMEQGKDVFVFPGSVNLPWYRGSNRLLQDGAQILLSPADLSFELYRRFGDVIGMTDPDEFSNLSFDNDTICEDIHSTYRKSREHGHIKPGGKPAARSVSYGSEDAARAEKPAENTDEYDGSRKMTEADLAAFDLSDNAKLVWHSLSEELKTADDLAADTNLTVREVSIALTELEIFGLVCRHPYERFTRA